MIKNIVREKRKRRVRAKVSGTPDVPRLAVRSSLRYIHAQLIDDGSGKTICEANDLKLKGNLTKAKRAEKVGEQIAEVAAKHKIKQVVFDRGARRYHGRIKLLAEAARKKGLTF